MKLRGELLRKGTHIGALIIPVIFLYLPRETALWMVIAGAIVALLQDILRIYHPAVRKAIYRMMGDIYRRWELKRLTGATYILSAAALAIIMFEKHIAALVMVYIIVGDTAAVFVGRAFGKHIIYARRNPDGTLRKKTIEGTTAFFVASAIAAMFIPQVPLVWKILGAFIATLVELVSFFIDDNITVPIIVGIILQFAIYGKLA